MIWAPVNDFYEALRERLSAPGYDSVYENESAFEAEVWKRVRDLIGQEGAGELCLTSHTERQGRSAAAFRAFSKESRGPDVRVLGSNNRLDIVVKHPTQGSIGIEVKCLGRTGHTGKLTQGLGQAMLALEHRDRTLLMIHCGAFAPEERHHLQQVADNICRGTRTAIVVVPVP
jgi:hypothetical protein